MAAAAPSLTGTSMTHPPLDNGERIAASDVDDDDEGYETASTRENDDLLPVEWPTSTFSTPSVPANAIMDPSALAAAVASDGNIVKDVEARLETEPPTTANYGGGILPIDAWAHVLGHLSYGEVGQARLICKDVGIHSMPCVRVLNIRRPSQMTRPSNLSFQFPNITEINILCLCSQSASKVELDSFKAGDYVLCADSTQRFVPFLSAFPKLETVFAGATFTPPTNQGILERIPLEHCCIYPETESVKTHLRSLTSALCGAFRTGTLSTAIEFQGLWQSALLFTDSPFHGYLYNGLLGQPAGGPCQWCRDICQYFPFECSTYGRCDWVSECTCLRLVDFYNILRTRSGGEAAALDSLRVEKKRTIEVFLIKQLRTYALAGDESNVGYNDESNEEEEGVESDDEDARIRYVPNAAFRSLDVALGRALGSVPRKVLSKHLATVTVRFYWCKIPPKSMWAKSTVMNLRSRGIILDPDQVVVVDETEDAVMQDLVHRIHEEAAMP